MPVPQGATRPDKGVGRGRAAQAGAYLEADIRLQGAVRRKVACTQPSRIST